MQPSIRDIVAEAASPDPQNLCESDMARGKPLLRVSKVLESGEVELQFYCPIAKSARTDNGLMVYGWASVTEYVDDQGEIVDENALREAVEEWKQWRNVRLMHQPEPIGVAPVIEFRRHPETGRDALWIGAHIVDDRAIRLVENGVLKGFSIGGQCLERDVETIEV
jgi:hypothetical protein